jgi:hypothetical protein
MDIPFTNLYFHVFFLIKIIKLELKEIYFCPSHFSAYLRGRVEKREEESLFIQQDKLVEENCGKNGKIEKGTNGSMAAWQMETIGKQKPFKTEI